MIDGDLVIKCKTNNKIFSEVQRYLFQNNICWCAGRYKIYTLGQLAEETMDDALLDSEYFFILVMKELKTFFFRTNSDLEQGLTYLNNYNTIMAEKLINKKYIRME